MGRAPIRTGPLPRTAAPCAAAVAIAAALAGCGAERAVRVEIEEAMAGDRLCLVAHGAGEIQFAGGYAWDELPEGERSLTFVAGSAVHDALRLTTRIGREGEIVARATALVRFADQGTVAAVLRPARCVPVAPASSGERAGGTFAGLPDGARVIAADLDGDGRDELCAIASDGSLQVLDAEDRDAGSRRATELRMPGASLVAAGDLDGDCRLELVAADVLGALVVVGASGAAAPPIGGAVTDVAIGIGVAGANGLAIAGADLSISAWDADAPRALATGAFRAVEAADLTGDGRGDLIAIGEDGLRAFVGGEDGLAEEPGALPGTFAALTGAIALGDLDADGALDLVAAGGATLRIALNRGDGLLEDRTGTPPALASDPVRIAVGDLDGDCADEIAVLGGDGTVVVLARDALGALVALAPAPTGAAVDVAIADLDGDGARELALVRAGGSVTLWRP